MFTILIIIAMLWLGFKFIGLALHLSWSLAKALAWVLFLLAGPMLILCLLAAGGALLLVPVLLILAAIGLLRSC